MNEHLGLIGRKLGMTQYHDEDGTINRVTAVEAGPCVIVNKRTKERDGYTALQLGFEDQKAHRVNKPETGHFAKSGSTPKKFVREIRLEDSAIAGFTAGQELNSADVFTTGQKEFPNNSYQ